MKKIFSLNKMALVVALLSAPIIASALPEKNNHRDVKHMSTWGDDDGGWGGGYGSGSGSGSGTDCGGGGTDVPLDGGLSLLLAAGIGYGAKTVANKRKKNKETEVSK